ncbi:MAG: DUF2254 domain-containing protein [Jannaschia sp.]
MHLSVYLWELRAFARHIWVRITLISGLALLAAGVTPLLSPLLPEAMKDRIDAATVTDLLSILTNSMLAVATFSLSVMVAAHHYAASQVTPRSHRLLRHDGRTQSVLATFIGAFVYALVALIVINAGLFDGRDYAVVYGVTILVIALVIVALVRWVQQISGLGSVEATTNRVEAVTRAAIDSRMSQPSMGARPAVDVPKGAIPIFTKSFGWVEHIDRQALSDRAETLGATIHLAVQSGDRITPGTTLMHVDIARMTVDDMAELEAAVVVGSMRSFDQDPAFGLEVMSEIAQRALSPGLNDPRTATDVVARQVALLARWRDVSVADEPEFPNLHVPSLSAKVLVNVALDCIARDGAHLVEVQLAVQRALAHLADHEAAEMRSAARHVSERALARSDANLSLAEDRAAVRSAAPQS